MRLLLIIMTLCSIAVAETRSGVELQGFSDPYSFVRGGMLGVHSAAYLTETNAYAGFSMMMGSANGGRLESDNLALSGGVIGYDTTFSRIFHVEAQALAGYGFGSFGKGVVVQPSVGAGFVMVNGWRAVFSIGYMAGGPGGWTFGFKLDRKTDGYGNGTAY